MGTVCVVGSINMDYMIGMQRLPAPGETLLGRTMGKFPGGKGFNQAVAAHRSGAAVRFFGRVGNDSEGVLLREAFDQIGLEDRFLKVDPDSPTGAAQVLSLPGSENAIIVVPGANAALDVQALPEALLGADVLMVQMEVGHDTARAALALGKDAGVTTILNAAPSGSVTAATLALADIVVVNETEAAELGGVEALLQSGPDAVVLTLGARGAEWHVHGAEPIRVPAFRITPRDTTGAGDAFCGALAAALSAKISCGDALVRAAAAGAIVAMATGAQTETLCPRNLDRMIARGNDIIEPVQ